MTLFGRLDSTSSTGYWFTEFYRVLPDWIGHSLQSTLSSNIFYRVISRLDSVLTVTVVYEASFYWVFTFLKSSPPPPSRLDNGIQKQNKIPSRFGFTEFFLVFCWRCRRAATSLLTPARRRMRGNGLVIEALTPHRRVSQWPVVFHFLLLLLLLLLLLHLLFLRCLLRLALPLVFFSWLPFWRRTGGLLCDGHVWLVGPLDHHFTEFYWGLPSFIEFYRVLAILPSCTGFEVLSFHLLIMSSGGWRWFTALSVCLFFTEFYWVFTRHETRSILVDSTWLENHFPSLVYRVLLGFTGFYWVSKGFRLDSTKSLSSPLLCSMWDRRMDSKLILGISKPLWT